MKLRRGIIANTPHLEGASGSNIHLMKAQRAKMPECVVGFLPNQGGSGDPSPSNVRPINGWTGLDLYVSPSQTASDGEICAMSWANEGTIYGGYVNLTTGVLTKTYNFIDLGTLTWRKSSSGTRFYASVPTHYPKRDDMLLYCSAYKFDGIGNPNVGYYGADKTIRYYHPLPTVSDSSKEFYIADSNYSNATEFQSAIRGVYAAYELATYNTYHLTPKTIKTLAGENYIWTDANGNINLTYWSH